MINKVLRMHHVHPVKSCKSCLNLPVAFSNQAQFPDAVFRVWQG